MEPGTVVPGLVPTPELSPRDGRPSRLGTPRTVGAVVSTSVILFPLRLDDDTAFPYAVGTLLVDAIEVAPG